MTYHKYILIRYPGVRSIWTNTHDCWFQTVNYQSVEEEWIRLYLSPVGGWTVKKTYSEDPEIKISSNRSLLAVTRYRQSFEGTVTGCHAAIYGMVEQLARLSTASNDSDAYAPVTILDYASPINVDSLQVAINTGADVPVQRSGYLAIDEVGAMIGVAPNLWLPGGFRFTFEELELRI